METHTNLLSSILQKIKDLEKKIDFINASKKEVLNMKEACDFLGLSYSSLSKFTSQGLIPHSKPNGGKIYFLKSDLEKWAMERLKNKQELSVDLDSILKGIDS